jgi:hypothetical protein
MNEDAVFLSDVQERVTNASSVLAVVTAAVDTGDCCYEDIGNACAVLYDYMDRIADIVGEELENKLRQQPGGD